jgi:hypothetical protein
MIIAQLIGGLGNQMFQYAAARRLAILKQTDLKFDISCFKYYEDREYDLDCFNIIEDFASRQEVYRLKGPDGKISRKIFKIITKIKPYNMRSYIGERQFNFDPEIFKAPEDVYLEGYWQSEKYFKEIEDIIRNEFRVKYIPDDDNKRTADKISVCDSVALHIRRGDYVTDKTVYKVHGTCSLEYYDAAVDMIKKNIDKPRFFIFSDDPEWAKNSLKLDNAVTFMDRNLGRRDYEDLRLMTLCKHFIIANSSFSWWGAWLCENPGKIVIAPKRWFNDPSINTDDLIPEGWHRL